MQKIGMYEEQALKLELEVSLQEQKKLMIQAAINRREPVDLEAIEKQLDEERANQLNRLNETYKAGTHQNETLTVEEKEELQCLYKDIVREFHPQVRSNMTIARLMDCGKKFIAIVDEPHKPEKKMNRSMAPTERGVPVSIYLVEG